MGSIISQKLSFFKLEVLGKFFWFILVFLLIVLSFLLGRLSKFMENSPTFTFESKEQKEQYVNQQKDALFGKITTETIVASKGGKKYYFVWCNGTSNIKESNKRFFATEELAQKAGYTLANNCK